MAVVSNFNNSYTDKNNDLVSKPISVSGASASSSAPSGPGVRQGSQAPTVQGGPSKSGRFQNLQGYLDANKDFNKQGGGLAGKMNTDLRDEGFNRQNTILNAQDTWEQQNKSKDVDRESARNYVNQALTYPGQVDPNKFQSYLNAYSNYQAPQQFDATQSLQNQVQEFNTKLGQTKDEAGRYSLLNQMYSNPAYSTGQQKLDNLLLQANPNQLNTLNNTQEYGQNLQKAYDITKDNVGDLANAYKVNNQSVQNWTRSKFEPLFTDFQTQADKAAVDLEKERNQKYEAAKSILGLGVLPTDLIKTIGMPENTKIYNVDPSQYLTKSDKTINALNAITPEQQQRIDDLTKLAGNYSTADMSKVISNFTGNTAAGTASKDPGFNTKDFSNAITSAESSYYNKLNNTPINVNGQQFNRQQLLDNINRYKEGLAGTYGSVTQDDFDTLAAYENALNSFDNAINSEFSPNKTLIGGSSNSPVSIGLAPNKPGAPPVTLRGGRMIRPS